MSGSALIVFAHPYPDRSRAGRVLLDAVRDVPRASVRSLYGLYPDFAIDVEAERAALLAAQSVVWLCPFYWYGVPALLHLWFEKVLAHGWAYGEGGTAVRGKRALWVTTTGAPETAYAPGQVHGRPFEAYAPAVEQTARFCGMRWEPYVVVHGAHRISDATLAERAAEVRARILTLTALTEADDA
ncbi:MAG: NAD(P)H-dependent oxidoreductase [Deltaproteobacteria bacterium]|nr:NAD(P)H-dependent oxidoreductase [Deltaproteobacteria bacterium]